MDRNDAMRLADELLDHHGLTSKGWVFQFDMARRRFGACHYTSRKITLSQHITEMNDEAEVRNTILHEIAHALAGHAAAHGPHWQRVCLEIGGDGVRCYSAARVATPPTRVVFDMTFLGGEG